MIIREKYLAPIREFYESDLVKVLTGIRRCGKSFVLEMIRDEIKKKSDNIIFLNFEKSSDFEKAPNAKSLLSYVENNRKEGKCYIFLDEIQEVEDWNKAVKDLRLSNASVFITGSNSKLLSNEFLTLLSGRFVSFQIRPFVYHEIQQFCREENKDPITPLDYLIWGGFPGRLYLSNKESIKSYLNDLENTIVINDLIRRYKINKTVQFKMLVNYILISNSRIFSARSIHRYMKGQGSDISLNTVLKYISYLKEAYVIDEIPSYSTKAKAKLSYYGKIYNADVSLNSLLVSNNRYDLDHNLENIVYNELVYRGYELSVYNNSGKEIDFLASKENKSHLVQVAYSVVDDKAYEREFNAFRSLDNSMQKILITTDENDYSTSTVRHISLKDFLEMDEL